MVITIISSNDGLMWKSCTYCIHFH